MSLARLARLSLPHCTRTCREFGIGRVSEVAENRGRTRLEPCRSICVENEFEPTVYSLVVAIRDEFEVRLSFAVVQKRGYGFVLLDFPVMMQAREGCII